MNFLMNDGQWKQSKDAESKLYRDYNKHLGMPGWGGALGNNRGDTVFRLDISC